MINLGATPDAAKVTVTPDQVFRSGMQAVEADTVTPKAWPPTTMLRIEFGGLIPAWPAVRSATDPSIMEWAVGAGDVDAVIAANPAGLRITLDGTRIAAGHLCVVMDGLG